MAYSGCVEDVRRAARCEKPERLPVFCCSEEFDVRMAGETYERFATDATVMADVIEKTIRMFDYDWAWLQVDDCLLFELLGVGVKGGGNILYATCDYLPATAETLKGLRVPDFKKEGRFPVMLDAAKRLKDTFGDDILVVGRTEGPFSAATLVYGIDTTMLMMFDNPQLLRDTMDRFVEIELACGMAQKEAGVDCLWCGDCSASSHLMGLEHYKEFAAPTLARLAAEYRKNDILTILHASEENPDYVEVMAGLGVDFVSVGPGGDLAECYKRAKGKCGLTGNVDPIGKLMNGTPDEVREQTRSIIETVSVQGGHIINSGEMTPRDCPEENIRAFVEAARETWDRLKG